MFLKNWETSVILLLLSYMSTVFAGENEETIFAFAEESYPQFFSPPSGNTLAAEGYLYRYYPPTDNYLGMKDNKVYVLGAVFGGLLEVGSIASTLALIPAPPVEGFTPLSAFEVRNDQPLLRIGEAAYSSIPLLRSQNILSTQQLAVVTTTNHIVSAQFNVVSRWGGVMDDQTLPIRWLEVSIAQDIAANSTNTYNLGILDTVPVNDAVTINAAGSDYIVNTGVASFTLNPQSPALFKSITMSSGEQVFTANDNAGPRLLLADNSVATASVDNEGFHIIQDGPVKVVVALNGHFTGAGTRCDTANVESYEAQAFTLIASFTKGQSYVDLQFQYRNECSSLLGEPWTDEAFLVNRVSYDLPLALSGNMGYLYAGGQPVQEASGNSLKVEQQHGSGTPWQRRAQVEIADSPVETATAFDAPMAGIKNATLAVSGQLAWMRFREPQAIMAANNTLSLQFISQPLTVGEARGIWNFARINISNNTDVNSQENLRLQTQAALERGLLVRVPTATLNTTQIFAPMGDNQAASQVKTAYSDMLTALHENTVNRQWAEYRTYGSQLWPEIQFSRYPLDNSDAGTPSNNAATMNYWNPSRNELLEFLRIGDPLWVWDFAMPQTWLQFFSAYANTGEHTHGNRNGFALTSGGCGRADGCIAEIDLGNDNLGHWNRSGFGSDDYTYTHGNVAYVLRPNYALLRRFAQAGKTVINRYGDFRDQYVSERTIQRQTIQHFVLLANCAEFVGGAEGLACHNRLQEIMLEFSRENFVNGYLCAEEEPSANNCTTPQQFMINSLIYPFFHRIYLNYGDAMGANLRRMLVNAPWAYYSHHDRPAQTLTPDYAGAAERKAISANSPWPNEIACNADGNCNANPFDLTPDIETFALLEANKPHTMAMYLIADNLEPQLNLCQTVKNFLNLSNADAGGDLQFPDAPYLQSLWFSNAIEGAGWSKGTSQMLQNMIFAVGLYDTCQ